ncbi:hypothetical protein like AT3G46850 [Hibiscus trionum]|uniref:Uncharacterized protein n=1 Tax=Hibiscus trionum TaxID=183268 RepID=A0A9W7MSF4_HIBTR|nr:hypothetical protein like AT3G46850 [Hibiscus trionum]
MRKSSFLLILHISVILMLCISLPSGAVEEDRKVYIAYLGSLPEGDYIPSSHHFSMLQSLLKQSSVENYLTRSYRRSFNGFAAKLTDEEAKRLASFKGVVSVFPDKVYHTQTTRSWDFMGLNQTVKRNATAESNVIIGVIDTGIWPESDSFGDDGFGPPPKKWKGSCNGGLNFTCNNKLIGARVYATDSVRDTLGHGSHTASTAAGNIVGNASFYGFAEGTARGGVPSARIAAYKVCNEIGCASRNILAGFDDAIADGVDILTVSLGYNYPSKFYEDPMAIGAFHAAEKGILVMQAAGNSGGSGPQSVASVAPWILTVAASTTDRLFIDKVVLGNETTLTGSSVNPFSLNRTKVPLVYGLQASTHCDDFSARVCASGCLNRSLVQNKIVVCDNMRGLTEAHDAGALGSITQTFDNVSYVVPLPASALTPNKFYLLTTYMNSTKEAVADLSKTETIEDSSAPVVAAFSSRGPNYIVPDILKPDITAPGVDILAAYSELAPPSTTKTDERRVKYNILSGTSMSCPHVAAVAAYVKTFHPNWSPSAIKSALITTASPMDPSKNLNGEFAYGSGHVNPVKAIDPGLVYDNVEGDNIRFLCSIGYSEDNIRKISGTNSSCPKISNKTLPRDLNYPTLTAQVKPGDSFTVNLQRTVTNVGVSTSTYNATISSNSKLEIEVIPEVLSFESLMEKKSYNVTVKGKALSEDSMASASLTWSDGIHKVRSPIVIHTYTGSPNAV